MGTVVRLPARSALQQQQRAISDAAWWWIVMGFATAAFAEAVVNVMLDAWRGDQ